MESRYIQRMPAYRRLEVRLLASLVFLMGAVNVISSLGAHGPGRHPIVRNIFGNPIVHGSRILTVVAGFFLMLLARGLWRHKRVAWTLSMLVLAASLALHLVKGLDYEEALVIVALMMALVLLRPLFHAASDPPSVWHGASRIMLAVVFTAVYGTLGFWLYRNQFTGIHRPLDALHATLSLFFQYGDTSVHPKVVGTGWREVRAWWFIGTIYWVSAGSLLYGFVMLFRPLLVRDQPTQAEREEVQGLLLRHGKTTIAQFCLLSDKHYFFNEARTGVIAYKLLGDVALVLGDPIAPDNEVGPLIHAFVRLCGRNDWIPGFYQVMPDWLDDFRAAGMKSLKVGEDAIIDLPEFTLQGSRMKKVRNAVTSMERRGVRAIRYDLAEDPLNLSAQLQEVSDLWLGEHKGSEKTFSLGYWDPEIVAQNPMMVALDEENRVLAFETLVPMYAAEGYSTDLMRRRPDAPNGVMEFVFAKEALALKEEGWKVYGMGLSPLSIENVPETEPGTLTRAVNLLYHHFNHFYHFTGLHAFKEKFNPRWESRYLIYPSGHVLHKVVLAVVRANSSQSLFHFLYKKRDQSPAAPHIPEVCTDKPVVGNPDEAPEAVAR